MNTMVTNLTGGFLDAPSMYMDGLGRSHCIWSNEGGLYYVYFNGTDWAWMGLSSLVPTNETVIRIDPNCVTLDAKGFPNLIYYGQGGLRHVYWTGAGWQEQSVASGALLSSTILNQSGVLYILSANQSYIMRVYSFGSVWTQGNAYAMPSTLDGNLRLLACPVQGRYHVFWRSSQESGVCVGYVGFNNGVFSAKGSNRIDYSFGSGDITGFDYSAPSSVITWTTQNAGLGGAYACRLSGQGVVLTESPYHFGIQIDNPPWIMTSSDPDFVFPFYTSPSIYSNTLSQPRIFCVSNGIALFAYSGTSYLESRQGIDSIFTPRKIKVSQYRISQMSFCVYLSNGILLAGIEEDPL